jgi:small subunit ribosomal protein S1
MAQAQATAIPAELLKEDFSALLEESFKTNNPLQGSVMKGRILDVTSDYVVIDVGLKSEGRVSLREFTSPGKAPEIKAGDVVDVFIERLEDRDGNVVLSREKARREESWLDLEKAFQKGERINGIIFNRVKGGFTVDLGGATAFLPGSQVDIRPVKDVGPLMGTPQPFMILKMDRVRGNIVVSRRAVLEESRAEARQDLIKGLKEGQILEGVVKNITDYGAFIDLGGVDGLLHVTDISWQRINHPSEALQIGQSITVQVIRFNQESGRISLGMKQLEADPWQGLMERFPIGFRTKGRVTNITDYGAFVEIESGIEGLVHVSEMSWTKKNVHPSKIVSTSQEVEVVVLDIDNEKRRISLGIKQCQDNPWTKFAQTFKEGQIVEGEVKNAAEFGLFIGLTDDIDGMIHLSDLSWDKSGEEALKEYQKGSKIQVKILEVDVEKERVALGIKQLTENPNPSSASNTSSNASFDGMKKGDIVTCTVAKVTDGGIEVTVKDLEGFIKKVDLSRDRAEQRPDRFAVGEKVDAKILSIEKGAKKLSLSIKAREIDEDKAAIAEYGSSDSGASLGDILGAALEASKTKKK